MPQSLSSHRSAAGLRRGLTLLWLGLSLAGPDAGRAQTAPLDAVPGLDLPTAARLIERPPAPEAKPGLERRVLTLAWDALSKEYRADTNETATRLVFNVTNISAAEVVIRRLRPSCGCTVAKMPEIPWRLAPGASGQIEVSTDLRGKRGVLNKTVAVETSDGVQWLRFKVILPPSAGRTADTRGRDLLAALADRQAVFRGGCVSCHVTPGVGKTGAALYDAACGICHDTPHRATMVPDLKNRLGKSSREYWTRWIRQGKDGTLMPGFAKEARGPLTEEQVVSLVEYLAAPE